MTRLLTGLVAASALVAAAVAADRPADAAPERRHATSLMHINARSATVVRSAEGRHRLVLRGVSGSAARQSTRPARPRSGELQVGDLVSAWPSWVSRAGARALVVQTGAGPARRSRVMRVGRPTWDRDRRELRMPAFPLRGSFAGLGPLGARNA
ncbi:MAG: hypothetical protein ACR2N6_02540, partial [Miltoncostaeaceae bacterium]